MVKWLINCWTNIQWSIETQRIYLFPKGTLMSLVVAAGGETPPVG